VQLATPAIDVGEQVDIVVLGRNLDDRQFEGRGSRPDLERSKATLAVRFFLPVAGGGRDQDRITLIVEANRLDEREKLAFVFGHLLHGADEFEMPCGAVVENDCGEQSILARRFFGIGFLGVVGRDLVRLAASHRHEGRESAENQPGITAPAPENVCHGGEGW